MKNLLATIRNNNFLIIFFPLSNFSSIIDPQTMGHPQGQGHLRHTRVAEAPDTGTVTGEATITGPQIIRQSLISYSLLDQPVPVNQMFKEIIEIKGIKEGNSLILNFLGCVNLGKKWAKCKEVHVRFLQKKRCRRLISYS